MSSKEDITEAENEEETTEKENPNKPKDKKDNESSGKNEKSKDKKQGDKWEDKQKEKEKARKEEILPWGSDPCVKRRLAGGKTEEERDLSKPAGSSFPWYEKPVNRAKYLEEQEKQRQKMAEKEKEENKEKSAEIEKRFRKKLKEMSKRNRRKRIYESSGFYYRTGIPFEVMERRKMAAKQRKRKELEDSDLDEEGEDKDEEGEEQEEKQQDEGEEEEEGEEGDVKKKKKGGKRKIKQKGGAKRKKKKKAVNGAWPGSYPQPVVEDFIFFLKLMVQAEYKTNESKKLPLPPKKTPDNRKQVVNEFVSFLDVLLTANQMMRENHDGRNKGEKEDKDEDVSEKDTTNQPSQISIEGEQENPQPEQIVTENTEE